MQGLIEAGLTNAVIATVLAVIVYGASRAIRNPAIVHSLWLLVLLKLMTPPVFPELVPLGDLSGTVKTAFAWVTVSPDGQDGLNSWNSTVEQEEIAIANSADGIDLRGKSLEVAASSDEAINADARSSDALTRLAEVAGWLWLTGSAAWFIYALVRIARFQRLLRQTEPALVNVQQIVANICRRIELRRAPDVRIVDARISPLVWGLSWRPTIVLPSLLLRELNRDELSTLLSHELAHVKRHDHWVRWFEAAVLSVYWWLPTLWWARRQLQRAEEICCDAWVVWILPSKARDYATALLRTVDFLAGPDEHVPIGASSFGRSHLLKGRFEMILRKSVSPRMSWSGRLAILVIIALVVPLSAQTRLESPTDPANANVDGSSLSRFAAGDVRSAVPSDRASALDETLDVRARLKKLENVTEMLMRELGQVRSALDRDKPSSDASTDLPQMEASARIRADDATLAPTDRGPLAWTTYSQEKVDELTDSGNPVMIWITADWCAACKVVEKTALNTDEVKSIVEHSRATPMLADVTQAGEMPEGLAWLNSKEIPQLVILGPKQRRKIVLTGTLQRQEIIDAINLVGP